MSEPTRPTANPTVSLLKANTYEVEELHQHLSDLLAPMGGMVRFVKPGDRVLLKPNLLTRSRPTKGCTTRPEIVYCVAKMVQAAGGEPFLGDSPAFGSAKGVAEANGLMEWANKAGVPVIEMHGKRYPVEGDDFDNFLLSKEAMEADVVINLPKLKSHSQLTMSMGVKNLFGCVPGKMKAWWHMEAGKDAQRFGTMLVETARAISPELTIVDGIVGQEGNGPINGEPRELGVLGASDNVFALDRAIAQLLNINPSTVPTIAESIRLGLCPQIDEMTFPLQTPEKLAFADWKLPEKMQPIDFGAPRVLRSTFKHLYIRFIKEPMAAYATR